MLSNSQKETVYNIHEVARGRKQFHFHSLPMMHKYSPKIFLPENKTKEALSNNQIVLF